MSQHVICLILICFSLSHATGQVLEHDPTFDQDGLVTYGLDTIRYGDHFQKILTTPDGKILVGGYLWSTTLISKPTLLRLNPDGSLDPTFGNGGLANIPDSIYGQAEDMCIQEDNKIVLGGTVSTNGFLVMRFTEDGELDPNFGENGVVRTYIDSSLARGRTIECRQDGAIFLGGFATPNLLADDYQFALLKYYSDGTLNEDFGEGGIVVTPFVSDQFHPSRIDALAFDLDGKIVAAGWAANGHFALAKYETNGDLDLSFGDDGQIRAIDSLSNGSGGCDNIAILSDGSILVGGNSYFPNTLKYTLSRYSAQGEMDLDYGTNGFEYLDFGNESLFEDLISLPSGSFLACGSYADSVYQWTTVISKLDSLGNLDLSFGTNGHVFAPTEETFRGNNSYTVQSDGKLLAQGEALVGFAHDLRVVRYLGDPSFSITGESSYPEIFPNPTTDNLTIELPFTSSVKVEFFSMDGTKLFSMDSPKTYNISIDFPDKGIFIVKVITPEKQWTRKVIKL